MKKGTFWIVIGLLLIAAALGLTAYNILDSRRAGLASDKVLEELTELAPQVRAASAEPAEPTVSPDSPQPVSAVEKELWELGTQAEVPAYQLLPEMEMPVRTVDGNDYIGVLSIPAIDRELPVISTCDYPKLRVAPCRYSGSAYLNTMTICAHNYDRHFGSLRTLSLGDAVTFTDMDGNVFTYTVAEIEVLPPTAIEDMTQGDWDLTLFTCTVGGRTRLAVRCRIAEP